jgi:hypothetical protein
MPATTILSSKILVFPAPTPASLELESHVSEVHFTVAHRQPTRRAMDKHPEDVGVQPSSTPSEAASPRSWHKACNRTKHQSTKQACPSP